MVRVGTSDRKIAGKLRINVRKGETRYFTNVQSYIRWERVIQAVDYYIL